MPVVYYFLFGCVFSVAFAVFGNLLLEGRFPFAVLGKYDPGLAVVMVAIAGFWPIVIAVAMILTIGYVLLWLSSDFASYLKFSMRNGKRNPPPTNEE